VIHGGEFNLTRTRGVTLVELLVVLAILGVMAGFAGLAWRGTPPWRGQAGPAAEVTAARRRAIATARPVSIVVTVGGERIAVTALPDGRVAGAARLGVDPETGVAVSRSAGPTQ
jgi:prepilin-type N-terminal cleavage/methylation domain-containing protein